MKDVVRLLGVKSLCWSNFNGQWCEMYNVKIGVNGEVFSFNSDLKEGVKNECKKRFLEENYSYNCFEAMYGRESKASKIECF